ncbi:MAG: hypothetical protein ABI594_08785 [Ginsengibacter sp.]
MNLTPKDFELLLCQFCKQDLPPTFKVEHDIKDFGSESENKRQIDTKITGRLGISNILICGEARNWNEPLGSDSIDGVIGKYLSGEIHANKIILFSNYGFTAPAITRAEYRGIELLEPKEMGTPIQDVPHVVAVGHMGQMVTTIIGSGPQSSEMAINDDAYIIIKGEQKLSFQQNFFRLIVNKLRMLPYKTIFTDCSTVAVKDTNVLYSLKNGREGHKYSADFEVIATIHWHYHVENLPTGVLHHINSKDTKLVTMQESGKELLEKVLLSQTKKVYETRDECVSEISKTNNGLLFFMQMVDPDQNKLDPDRPLFVPV